MPSSPGLPHARRASHTAYVAASHRQGMACPSKNRRCSPSPAPHHPPTSHTFALAISTRYSTARIHWRKGLRRAQACGATVPTDSDTCVMRLGHTSFQPCAYVTQFQNTIGGVNMWVLPRTRRRDPNEPNPSISMRTTPTLTPPHVRRVTMKASLNLIYIPPHHRKPYIH